MSTQSPEFKILLVEDNDINQEVVQGILEDAPLSIEVASDGLQAIEQLKCCDGKMLFSLVLMDCQMPNMDGHEASRQIRSGAAGSAYQDIPIIALTAHAMKGDKDLCLESGMSDYLTKPIDIDELQQKLSLWLKADIQLF